MPIAITRAVSGRMGACELTHLAREPINMVLAREQHRRYEAALVRLGCEVVSLPELADLPDSVFVEDVAVVVDELAVITRPGAESRRPEAAHIREPLARLRPVVTIEAPGTLDGGDVLRVGRRVYVGRSGRSNQAGIDQLLALLRPHGYEVVAADVTGCLHLKSAVTEAAPGVLLLNPAWIDPATFGGIPFLAVDPLEPHAANGLLIRTDSIGEAAGSPQAPALIYPASFPRTRALLESRGIPVEIVDVSELQKAEGAVTCCSLLLRT